MKSSAGAGGSDLEVLQLRLLAEKLIGQLLLLVLQLADRLGHGLVRRLRGDEILRRGRRVRSGGSPTPPACGEADRPIAASRLAACGSPRPRPGPASPGE